ncbi:hypothetical protein [Colwellia piezophila]|uniref:hypothetical protein n=1 Tax=Colwellia piezophila TaxID=211668 RepID=UPI00036F2DF7|nr:hypothetical protein [Colwellia piezophila]
MGTSDKKAKLPFNVRLLIGVFAIPSLYLAYMIGVMAVNGDYQKIDYIEWVYSFIGFVAVYVAVTGKRLF